MKYTKGRRVFFKKNPERGIFQMTSPHRVAPYNGLNHTSKKGNFVIYSVWIKPVNGGKRICADCSDLSTEISELKKDKKVLKPLEVKTTYDYLDDMIKEMENSKQQAVITDFPPDSNWVKGTFGDYVFNAKLFDIPSSFGIPQEQHFDTLGEEGGRVSKLGIMNSNNEEVIVYDRGWFTEAGKMPEMNEEVKTVFNAVMKVLEESPQRFNK